MPQAVPLSADYRFIDHTGQRFGRLAVVSYAGRTAGGSIWNCLCDCGKPTRTAGSKLRAGASKSCGCQSREGLVRKATTHGRSGTREHSIWKEMRYRCHRTTHPQYPDYGGRGILMCQGWAESFEEFLADMGPRPSPGHSLDRIDNDGPYAPGNCRWATDVQQARNKRSNRLLAWRGKTQCVSAWAEEIGVSNKTLHARLASGMSVEQALTHRLHAKPNSRRWA